MALWSDPSQDKNGDIPTFFFSQQTQPASGPAIVVGYSVDQEYAAGNVDGVNIDWSRVIAVEVDEPYKSIDSVTEFPDGTPACQAPGLAADIAPIDMALQQRATELKALAPKARFWVNFTQAEANWMAVCHSPLTFNRAYIDVISADWYWVDYSAVEPFYSYVEATPPKPDQQMALIPGTFYRSNQDQPQAQADLVQSYFAPANTMNQNGCYLPLGDRGVTGYFDGCLLWIVLGWEAPNDQMGGTLYVGLLDPTSGPIQTTWQTEFRVPHAPAFVNQRSPAWLIQPILQQLLN